MPDGTDPAALRFLLHHAADGGLTYDSERIYGDDAFHLRYDPKGLPDRVVEQYPHLKGYLALKFIYYDRPLVRELLKGQLAVGQYDDAHKIIDGTVDPDRTGTGLALRQGREAVVRDRLGAKKPTFRLWAPTARRVTLLTWPPNSADAPASAAKRTPMTRASDGSWSATAAIPGGARYLYEVQVYVPSTDKMETNLVTDPYSVALTLNSTRSVAIDLANPSFMPSVWATTAGAEAGPQRRLHHL